MTSATHWIDDALWSRSLNYDLARAMVGQTLQFFWGDAQGQTHVALLQVEACHEGASTASMQQFSLDLSGPAEPLLPQQTYRVRHAEQGDFAVMITPVARQADGFVYQAAFSHAR
ncbi:DUF6916 family protein [Comamonas sp. J-3]|uniref:DUF6916 family protein n=1 Tax=Comamonas trifloxystrobinivorans TaxID=3350256 RepID=UPI00372A990E